MGMNGVQIRKLQISDYEGVRAVDILTQRQYLGEKFDALSEASQQEHLVSRESEFSINANSPYSFVAVLTGKIIGFLLAFETLPFRGNIYISYIGIDPKFQGQGVGKLLYDALIKVAGKNKIKTIKTLINLDNPRSINLHKEIGFKLTDRKEAVLTLD